MDLVGYHWSGKHQRVVRGMNLVSLLWTDGQAHLPCDCWVYDPSVQAETKQTAFRRMLQQALKRGFRPQYVLFDSWYGSLENFKVIRSWRFFTRLKSNRLVNPDQTGNVPISTVGIPTEGRIVHLKGFDFVKVFRTVAKNGDADTGVPTT